MPDLHRPLSTTTKTKTNKHKFILTLSCDSDPILCQSLLIYNSMLIYIFKTHKDIKMGKLFEARNMQI